MACVLKPPSGKGLFMFEKSVAADIGSRLTRLATKNSASCEESRLALDPNNTLRILAAGSASRALLNTAEAYPISGKVADITLAAILLRRLTLNLLGRKTLVGLDLFAALPSASGELERAALLAAGREAGFRRVRLCDSMAAGAVGAGLDPNSARAFMLADIGRERLNTAVFANGGCIAGRVSRRGSVTVDRRIKSLFALEHHLLITSREAELLKMGMGSAVLRVGGRDAANGFPAAKELRPSALREAVRPAVEAMAREITAAIEELPPDAAADLYDSGITLIGGGAKQYGIADELSALLHVPVRAAQNPEHAVILGMQQMLRESAPLAQMKKAAGLAGSLSY